MAAAAAATAAAAAASQRRVVVVSADGKELLQTLDELIIVGAQLRMLLHGSKALLAEPEEWLHLSDGAVFGTFRVHTTKGRNVFGGDVIFAPEEVSPQRKKKRKKVTRKNKKRKRAKGSEEKM